MRSPGARSGSCFGAGVERRLSLANAALSQRCAAHLLRCGYTFIPIFCLPKKAMERREAPGVCETPLGLPCDQETRAPLDFASRCHLRGSVRFQSGVANPAPGRARPATRGCEALARTLRLPALHQPANIGLARYWPLRPTPGLPDIGHSKTHDPQPARLPAANRAFAPTDLRRRERAKTCVYRIIF